jgi:hypothetical protein
MKLDPAMLRVLQDSGLQWEVVTRRRHRQLLIEGRLVETLSRCTGEKSGRQTANALAAVRRHIRQRSQS